MSSVIDFLASVGQDSERRYLSLEEITADAPEPIVRCAGNWALLRDAIGATKVVCCDLSKSPNRQEEEEEEPSRDDDEVTLLIAVRSAA